ncbi:5-(carboxyamino)imidazole ribonucleotide synthase [Pseudomaricurvus alcaniphilus]|uniref:5-(carboxyamino)imidazole ribonucleotide synthase n=1 Tax=Pseudomaricurvus alcaniphilus TaxID=1166482 RepID=UPI00140A94A7|nr:5-(carboxyamino)imidazole ribonucleotide synthase [Pseudomaricurvus alcaniphilus]NHN36576.1 5-(carboxyamino)imidazole ribonucleotide synthase [Pseudomaricurvus alcaniphilus]
MSRVWVLGHGQLGAMLQHAAMPLNVDVVPVDIDSAQLPDLQPEDVVTAEREQWPQTPVTEKLATHPNFVNLDVFARLADRYTQKQLLDQLGLATAPWRLLDDNLSAAEIHAALGERALLKRRTGGYDGRGQLWLKQAESTAIPDDWRNLAIVEQGINFDEEMAIVGVRDRSGNKYFYPLTLTLQLNGVLTASVAPLQRLKKLQRKAELMLGTLLDELDYVGVLAMECFRVGDELIVNELAPRVHNTAHWTQAGASVSQFESHVRAVAGIPLAKPQVKGLNVMINLLGTPYDERWWAISGAEPYWYGKEVRPGRKVGHITFTHSGDKRLIQGLDELKELLPPRYEEVIDWVEAAVEGDSAE